MTRNAPPLAGASQSSRLSGLSPEPEHQTMHFRPVWIVLILLLPCLALTFYYSQIVAPGGEDSDSFLPTTSYAFVLLLLSFALLLALNALQGWSARRLGY